MTPLTPPRSILITKCVALTVSPAAPNGSSPALVTWSVTSIGFGVAATYDTVDGVRGSMLRSETAIIPLLTSGGRCICSVSCFVFP